MKEPSVTNTGQYTTDVGEGDDPLAFLLDSEGGVTKQENTVKKTKKADKPANKSKASGERQPRGIPGLNLTNALREFFANPKGKTSKEAVAHVLKLTEGSKTASGGKYTEAHAVDRVAKVLLGMGKAKQLRKGDDTREGDARFIFTGTPKVRATKKETKASPPAAPAAKGEAGADRKPRAKRAEPALAPVAPAEPGNGAEDASAEPTREPADPLAGVLSED